jgi:WD40 repeat protein
LFQAKNKDGKNKHLSKIAWYINNSSLIASGNDGTLFKYDLDGKILLETQAHEPSVEIRSFAFARDYSILATAAVNGCRVFDPENFQLLKTFKQ